MVCHQSLEASKSEQSSKRRTFLMGTAKGIALLLLLLTSWSIIPSILSICPTQFVFMNHHQKPTKLIQRNQYIFNLNTYLNVSIAIVDNKLLLLLLSLLLHPLLLLLQPPPPLLPILLSPICDEFLFQLLYYSSLNLVNYRHDTIYYYY